jgi:hypothetical protein
MSYLMAARTVASRERSSFLQRPSRVAASAVLLWLGVGARRLRGHGAADPDGFGDFQPTRGGLMKISFSLASVIVLVGSQSFAGDYEDRKNIAETKGRFDTALSEMNQKCGTKFAGTYDLKSEKYERERYDSTNKKWIIEPNRESGQFRLVAGYGYDLCATVFAEIGNDCKEDAFKDMIKEKISRIECEFKHLNKFETELNDTYTKTRVVPPGYQLWEVDGQRDHMRHEYKKGVLKTLIDSDLSNSGTYTAKYLRRKL